MRVKTIRKHGNSCGDSYAKNPGKLYDHPDPRRLIADGLVEPAEEAAKKKAAGVAAD